MSAGLRGWMCRIKADCTPGVRHYAAKRLAYSIIGEKDNERVKMIQFHQSYSYEDFIIGYRPKNETDGFELKEGVFYKFCKENF